MHTGDILRSIRLTIKATCPLNLEYFPMDKQMCTLEIESFGYTMSGAVTEHYQAQKSILSKKHVWVVTRWNHKAFFRNWWFNKTDVQQPFNINHFAEIGLNAPFNLSASLDLTSFISGL